MNENVNISLESIQTMTFEYFKLLAQQRVTHFNLFIVFIGAMSTAYATQIGNSMRGNIIAFVLSLIEIFLCFIFHKIDLRNKFLIKHTEKMLIQIEDRFENTMPRLFAEEVKSTASVRCGEKGKFWAFRQLSTSQLYNSFYAFFSVTGILALVLSIVLIGRSI
jgi:hypothetical protein